MSLEGYFGRPVEVIASDELCLACAKEAEETARWIATHLDQRQTIVFEGIWESIGLYWEALVKSFHPTVPPGFEVASEDSRRSLALSLAKLERNLVAGFSEHQAEAYVHETSIRDLIFNLTTFARIEDANFFLLHAVLTQLLSNIVSPSPGSDDRIASKALTFYLSGKREDDVIMQDVKTNQATLHLISNLLRNSPPRQSQCLDPTGVRWLGRILSRIDEWHDKEDGRFELAVELFNLFIISSLHRDLYLRLGDTTEPITPSQTSLLKLVDSFIAQSQFGPDHTFLIPLFTDYSRYALISMGSGQDDARLPKVFEGMVLICESFVSICLAVQAQKDKGMESEDRVFVPRLKEEVIKPLIDLLAALNKLIPRVKPGTATLSAEQAAPVTLLKRLLVQLIGILTFDDPVTGDRVRECGGVELVLGLTEVDESNPYLREHALLAVRNLMLNNPANQAIISQMDPVGIVSEQGEVLPLPEKMKKR